MAPSPPKGGGQDIKPTILAFHGSGSNATIHTVQLARLMRVLRPHFNVESLEAPFDSQAGPGILPFFDGCGPFKRWLPSTVTLEEMRSGTSTSDMAPEVEKLVRDAVYKIRGQGGRVVGLIGFSQGTKIVAGLLAASQALMGKLAATGTATGSDWCAFAFGISICGSYAPPLFPPSILGSGTALSGEKIRIPCLHVQGLQDQWKWAGQGLIEGWYLVGEGGSVVKEWDMGHFYPVRGEENEEIGRWVLGVVGEVGGGGNGDGNKEEG
ncbi:hypothetical protein BDW02DRAFT_503565 [Decorospora gaudefroyi]|uniref:Serine hydrolase domain-containing protein n=1 Tax=Decorospora gaudefroyi TaxID=184978 RepID=A0A6A5K6L0_9PLEO|nr:hypothetical protein BDW02DRAFT_503565 [Decorospora gaudefroyi]